jgi:hypothetical protein
LPDTLFTRFDNAECILVAHAHGAVMSVGKITFGAGHRGAVERGAGTPGWNE